MHHFILFCPFEILLSCVSYLIIYILKNAANILQEVEYFKSHDEEDFEFPYGTSWLLKIADELISWNDPKAKEWLTNFSFSAFV